MGTWEGLREELDAWSASGRVATLWWRDDDAVRATPELHRLLALSAAAHVPVALAVIPRDADGTLYEAVEPFERVATLQHGWGHDNHAPTSTRQEEFGPHRPRAVMLEELARGRQRLAAFPRSLPVLVAPWNRMDLTLLPDLPTAGLNAVSTLGPREAAEPFPGVRRTNVHVDIVDWQGTGGFVGDEAAVEQVIAHLQARRLAEVDPEEPTGLMTHHLFHDEGCWQFLAAFVHRTAAHPGARWLDAREAFWP
jgi:hypothetical protein